MTEFWRKVFVVVAAAVLVGTWAAYQLPAVAPAHAAVRSDSPSWGYTATVNVLDGGTRLFTCHPGSNAFSVYNNGPNPIFIGFDSAVTTDSGYPIQSGSQIGIDMYCNADKSNAVYGTVGEASNVAIQAAPANTRIIEVR